MPALAFAITAIADLLTIAIILRAILSWFPTRTALPLIAALDLITEPILAPLRRIVPTVGMFDITPLVAILLLQFIAQAVVSAM